MRLRELTGYKQDPLYQLLKHSFSIVEFIENLRREGYKKYLIGEGLYAGVFARPGDSYVIKLFQQDPGYEKFLKYILVNQQNPHVPQIKGKPVTIQKYYKIVRLEKLAKMSSDHHMDTYNRIISYVSDYGKSYANTLNLYQLETQYPQLIPLLQELSKNKYLLDLSKNNILFRGDVPVITDPYAEWDHPSMR
jgi:hypothetical protein